MSPKHISVVIPVYDDEEVLPELHRRLGLALDALPGEHEIVFVDDGSGDGSYRVLAELHAADRRVRVVRLARNFGQQNATAAGLAHARGELVVVMDSDLQDRPEDIARLIEAMEREDTDMAVARWKTRGESSLKRAASKLFYLASQYTTGIKYEEGLGAFRVIRRRALEPILAVPETTGTVFSMMYWAGIDYAIVDLDRDPRAAGSSGYNLRKMIGFAADRIFSYSLFPIRLASRLGALLGMGSLVYAAYLVIRSLLWADVAPGWASTSVLITLLFGLNFLFLGVIGEYLGRIYVEAKGRPRFIVSRMLDQSRDDTA
jgi:dolichol-phosphate mannosyltransferase